MLRKPSLEVVRPWRAPAYVLTVARQPPNGLQFYCRKLAGHGFHDIAAGLPELRQRKSRVIRTIAYAMWLDGSSIEKIARDFGLSRGSVKEHLKVARKSMSTLKVVHEAVGKLDRIGVPLAVDRILRAIEAGDTEAAFKLLAGRQVLARAGAAEGPRPGEGAGPDQVFAGVQVVIKHADGSTVQMGTVVGQPLAGPDPIIPIDGTVVE